MASLEKIDVDTRVHTVSVTDNELIVTLKDGDLISVPLVWFPRLFNASPEQRARCEIAGAGYGIYWPELDEDLSVEGLLRFARAPNHSETWKASAF